jgi:O-antigen/teichoic acid export membrane protein
MFAGMSHLRSTQRGVRDTYRALLRFVALLGCPVGVVLMVAADPFVEVVLGDAWVPAGAVLAVLGLRSVLLPLTGMAVWMLNGAGLSRPIGTYTTALLVPFAVAVVVAAALGGIVAVAYVLLADALLWSALVVGLSARWRVVGLRDHLTVLAPLAVATAGAAIAGWAAAGALDGRSPLLVLLGSAGGALVVFVATELLLDRRGVRESVALARGRAFADPVGADGLPD